jgi:putative sugar O-methyltransferase
VAAELGLRRYHLARLLGKESRLRPELRSLLEEMRSDNAAAPPPFRATAHWTEVARLFDECFYLEGLDDVETAYFNLRFWGFAPGDQRLHRYLVYAYFQLLRPRDSLGLLEKIPATCPLGPGFAYEIESCKVSMDLLTSIDDFYSLLELQPDLVSAPVIVADIGAGWGRLGYVLKHVNPKAAYVVFDIPEVLLISSHYLPKVLPGIPYKSYRDTREDGRLDRQTLLAGGMWFLGTPDLTRVDSLDVVVNIFSFQEMTETQVGQYFEIISRIAQGGSIFLRQLWTGRTHGHHVGEINGYDRYPFPPTWGRVFLRNARFSPDFFETAYRVH